MTRLLGATPVVAGIQPEVAFAMAQLGLEGVVLALASLAARQDKLTWLAIGYVEGRLIRRTPDGRREAKAFLHSGIVGHRLPKLHPTTIAIWLGDVLAIATDGIHSAFETEIRSDLSPPQAANRVLARCAKPSDDALVLAGHWIGHNAER